VGTNYLIYEKAFTHFLSFTNNIFIAATAQNVGIGNATPKEKLDVSGNINVTGTIKANGADGQPNQVLMKNSAGSLAWGNTSQYSNTIGFFSYPLNPLNITWVVPTGVTQIFAELWGGGGGGGTTNSSGGGGGGGYAACELAVKAGDSMIIFVAPGGKGAPSNTVNGTDGGQTTLTKKSDGFKLYANGGGTGSIVGEGGDFGPYYNGGPISYYPFGYYGTSGIGTTVIYGQINATNYLAAASYGSGGQGGNTNTIQQNGGYRIVNNTTGVEITSYGPYPGTLPGGGGGAWYSSGANGGNGMVIIHY
jgi:hypothetical protein